MLPSVEGRVIEFKFAFLLQGMLVKVGKGEGRGGEGGEGW